MPLEKLAFSFIPGIGPITANRILEKFLSAKAFFQADERTCLHAGLSEKICREIGRLKKIALEKAEQELENCQKSRIRLLFREDPDFPSPLKMCPDSPLVLYRSGTANIDSPCGIAVVGTRRSSSYGRDQTRKIVEGLQGKAAFTVSGLAAGIDAEAHLCSLDNQIPTVAVLAHGLDRIYPPENTRIACKILENGGSLISEMPTSTPITAGLFPRRNRIIAGLAQATLVIESSLKGGAMRTAYAAESYQRLVFAVPGRNDHYYHEGCNALIAEGKALLVRSARDICLALGWECEKERARPQATPVPGNEQSASGNEQRKILEIMETENPASWDILLKESKMEPKFLSACLSKMEIAGIVRSLPGNFYEKT